MATAGIPCTSLGIYVAHLLSQQWLSRLFSIVMLLVAVRFLRTHPAHNTMHRTHTSARLYGRINPKTGKFNWNWPTAFLLGTMGSVTGFITGLLGVGGGFIIVPMLSHFTDAPLRSVIATSLLVIALTSSGSIVMTLAQGVSIPLAITLYFTGATALGMLIGRVIAQHIKVRTIQHGFGYLLILVAIGLFIKTIILIGPNL